MRSFAVAMLVLLALASCGDGQGLNAEGTTTTSAASPTQPHCIPEGPPPPGYGRPDAAEKHAALIPDMDVIRAYGDAHPDEFTSVVWEYTMGQRLLAYFTGHLDEHRAALTQLVANPDDFEVRQGVHSFAESRAIAEELQSYAPWREHAGSVTWGTSSGSVGVNLRSTKAGRAAADSVRSKYGDGVCITIGGHPHPKGAWPDTSSCSHHPPTFDENDDLGVVFELDKDTAERGEIVTGKLRVTNNGDETLAWPGGSALGADVLERPSGKPVGANRFGGSTAEAAEWVAAPGQTITIPVRLGTDDCRPDADYSLPAGTYDVVTGLMPNGGSATATLKITD